MSIAIAPKLITLTEFLAIPEDDIDRELIRGEIREKAMTKRNRFHAKTEAAIAGELRNWLIQQPKPRGDLYSGEVGCILLRNPDTNVGMDVAYFSAETVASQTDATTMTDGVPVLAVEILSPSDKVEDVAEKVDLYLEAGVGLVWIVDPHFKTVTIHRSDAAVQLVNSQQRLSGFSQLPSFDIAVSELFA